MSFLAPEALLRIRPKFDSEYTWETYVGECRLEYKHYKGTNIYTDNYSRLPYHCSCLANFSIIRTLLLLLHSTFLSLVDSVEFDYVKFIEASSQRINKLLLGWLGDNCKVWGKKGCQLEGWRRYCEKCLGRLLRSKLNDRFWLCLVVYDVSTCIGFWLLLSFSSCF